jgi:transcriptional repressor NrdR
MKCPACESNDDKVIDSRPAEDGSSIRRRRECLVCGSRFTTYERVEDMPLMEKTVNSAKKMTTYLSLLVMRSPHSYNVT